MADGEAPAALLLHRADDPAEQIQLLLGIGGAGRVRLVGYGKVGENALGVQARQGAGAAYIRRAGVEMLPGDEIAQAGHPGVHLDVHRQRAAQADGLLAVLQCLGLAGHGLGDVQVHQAAHLLTGRMTEDEDGHGDTAMAQLGGLVDAGHGQIVRPQGLQRAGHLHRAVAVGVRLDHAQEFHAHPHPLPQGAVVIGQCIQVDLRPRSLQC